MSSKIWLPIGLMIGFGAGIPIYGTAAQEHPEAQPAKALVELSASASAAKLSQGTAIHSIHIFPTAGFHAKLLTATTATPTPLVYHSNGPVMTKEVIYNIYWVPAKLQNGAATTLPAAYQIVQNNLMAGYPGHGVGNVTTQYYQNLSGVTTYIGNSFGGTYVDASAYPASGCNDSATPGNCLTDAQIQAEVKKVVAIKHWPIGLNTIFFLYTSQGEGSCFDSTSASCAYTQYCAYHGAISGTTPIIYANMPYGDPANCQNPGVPSPNNNPDADTAATAASHELTEAITDPELNAWYTAQGEEIGDLCAYQYGANTWLSGKANQMWNGSYFELQQEYDNHTNTCLLVGPQ